MQKFIQSNWYNSVLYSRYDFYLKLYMPLNKRHKIPKQTEEERDINKEIYMKILQKV